MTFAPTELARRLTPDTIAFRHDPLRLSLAIADLVAADGHGVDIHAAFSVRVVERHADMELFKEQFLNANNEPRVSIDDVRARIAVPLRSSLGEFVARHEAAACLKQRDTLAALLLDRANEIGFACGIEFLAPADVTLQSDSLAMAAVQTRLHSERQRDAEQSAKIAQLLRDVPAHLLPAEQQASALGAIINDAVGDRLGTPYLVAGPYLASLDLASGRLERKSFNADDLGPLRSVCYVDSGIPSLAIGGQRGVIVRDWNAKFTINAASERGVNSIAYHEPTQRLVATHGEIGLLTWAPLGDPGAPEVFTVPSNPRNLLAIDERILFSAGNQPCVFDGQAVRTMATESTASILRLLRVGERSVVVRESGRIELLDHNTLAVASKFDRTEPIASACEVFVGGLQFLAIANRSANTIDLVTLRGESVAQFRSPPGPPRMLASCGRHLIGASPDRASLLVWNLAQPGNPVQHVGVLAALGHRTADLVGNNGVTQEQTIIARLGGRAAISAT